MWQDRNFAAEKSNQLHLSRPTTSSNSIHQLLVADVPPPLTVVLEGRSICHRISLHKHNSYESLARALRDMFVDDIIINDSVVDLTNAVPGYIIAYEDMENDLLLVGDLNWKDFVRVAKRIRILPSKQKQQKKIHALN